MISQSEFRSGSTSGTFFHSIEAIYFPRFGGHIGMITAVSENQFGFTPGRSSMEAIYSLR